MNRRLGGGVLLVLALLVPAGRGASAQVEGPGLDLSSLPIPEGMFELRDLALFNGSNGGMVAIATTALMGSPATVLISMGGGTAGNRPFTFALQPREWSLGTAFPALANPVLDGLPFDKVGLVITNQEVSRHSSELTDDEWVFYREIYQADEFELRLTPGLNLIAAIPTADLEPGSPLAAVMQALGIESGTILLQGTLGRSLAGLGGGAGAAAAFRDVYLRAELPPMRPPGSPEWFRSGQLALEVTGEPSIRLVGEMGVTIDEADLEFFLAAMLARTGVSLAGGMKAVAPWVAPFGVEWLTLKQVILSIGITPTGSVALGFRGAAVIGEKDIDVAVGLAVSPAGVPTNFMMSGESETGVALADLARVQAGMAAARDRATGGEGAPPLVPLDALPPIELRSLALQFAPKPDPVLGVEQGFKLKGELWLGTGGDGELRNVAGVDAGVTEDGLWVKGHLGAFQVGPLTWEDAVLDLAATRDAQHLIIKGEVQLAGSRQLVDLQVSRDALRFRTETELFSLFRATLSADAAFNLRNPSFTVHGLASSEMAAYIQPLLREGMLQFATTGASIVEGAETALAATRQALGTAEATAAQLRQVLEQQRGVAEAAWRAVQAEAVTASQSVGAATRARDAARRLWQDTPLSQPAVRASRRAELLRLETVLAARVVHYGRLQAGANLRRAVLDAIPPVGQNVLVLRAEAAVAEVRARLQEAERGLAALSERYAAVIAAVQGGADPLVISEAEFQAALAAVQGGGSLRWRLRGAFIGQPFELERELNFASPATVVAELLTGLVRG